jgi:hypothetical protein
LWLRLWRSHGAVRQARDSGTSGQGCPLRRSAKAPLGQARKKSCAEITSRSRTGAKAWSTAGENLQPAMQVIDRARRIMLRDPRGHHAPGPAVPQRGHGRFHLGSREQATLAQRHAINPGGGQVAVVPGIAHQQRDRMA